MSVTRWQTVLDAVWRLNRVHVGDDMSAAYRTLAAAYPGTRVFGYPSGEACGTWTAPPAWTLRRARLTAPGGRVIADAAVHPLAVFAYSPAFTGDVSLDELQSHLLSDPNRPDAIPFHFRNQYRHWSTEWGFCVPHNVRETLAPGTYRVEIDTAFAPGMMEMAEQVHAGDLPASLLLVGHFDHPALCNDGLGGCLAGHEALARLEGRQTHLTYRMLSTVEIVGSVFYAERVAKQHGVREAVFVSTSSARAPLSYQTSATGTAFVDRAIRHLLAHVAGSEGVRPFRSVYGNDEIAYDVGGVNIPCGSLMRFPYPEYHTSDDNPAAVDADRFEESVSVLLDLIDVCEQNASLHRRFSGLPCLASPDVDLYLAPPVMSGVAQAANATSRRLMDRLRDGHARAAAERAGGAFFTLMNLLPTMSEGAHTTLDLAERAGVPFAAAHAYTEMWVERGLLEKRWQNPFPAR